MGEKDNEVEVNARQEEVNVYDKKAIQMTRRKKENAQNENIWDDCCKSCNSTQTITALLSATRQTCSSCSKLQ
jgi:hypothetical protein